MTRAFQGNEVVCDYQGELLNAKDGKSKYEASPEGQMGFMFAFKHKGTPYWLDGVPEEVPGAGRLINHSRCHPNVIIHNCDVINFTFKCPVR